MVSLWCFPLCFSGIWDICLSDLVFFLWDFTKGILGFSSVFLRGFLGGAYLGCLGFSRFFCG